MKYVNYMKISLYENFHYMKIYKLRQLKILNMTKYMKVIIFILIVRMVYKRTFQKVSMKY